MAEGSWKVVVGSVALAVVAGVGTAWFMVPLVGPPGGPVVAGPDLKLEEENRRLREQVQSLQRQVAEEKLQAAARKALPPAPNPSGPGGGAGGGTDPAAERLLRDADEITLRNALDRAAQSVSIEKERRDAVVKILLDASGRMRRIQARIAAAAPGDRTAAGEAEDLGRETRRGLEGILSAEQLKAVDLALGAPKEEAGMSGDGGRR